MHLRAGLDLFDAGAEGWVLQGLDGGYTRVHVPADLMTQAAPVLWGRLAPATALADECAHEDLAELLERFAAAGYLDEEPARAAGQGGRVLLVGSGAIASSCARLLGNENVSTAPDLAALDGPAGGLAAVLCAHDVVLACAQHLTDAAWLRLDELCRQHGRPWQRCHIEGHQAWIGPCTLPGPAAGYSDLRARRLAAEALPRLRAAHWQALDRGPAGRSWEPSAPAAALVAALLVQDVVALLRGAAPPGAGRLTRVALTTLEIHHHHVLPVPQGLMRVPVA